MKEIVIYLAIGLLIAIAFRIITRDKGKVNLMTWSFLILMWPLVVFVLLWDFLEKTEI